MIFDRCDPEFRVVTRERTGRPKRERNVGAVLACVTVLWLGCAGGAGTSAGTSAETARPTPTPLLAGNQLANPGLERDTEGWGQMGDRTWIGFETVESPTHTGERSAHLRALWEPGQTEQPVHVTGLVQERSPTRFPTRLGGWFRVESWENPSKTTKMYLQAVVIVSGDPRTREIVSNAHPDANPAIRNYQIRYYLGGVTQPPFEMANGKLINVRPGPPPVGQWVNFELPIRDDFEAQWGVVPEGYDYLRVFFELRWDDKEPGVGLSADVYYDDLYFGFEPWP